MFNLGLIDLYIIGTLFVCLSGLTNFEPGFQNPAIWLLNLFAAVVTYLFSYFYFNDFICNF